MGISIITPSAYPILRQHNFPALIFLTTEHIGTDVPFYWDMAAYCFHHTESDHLTFPDGRVEHWSNQEQLDQVSKNWIEFMKTLPHAEKQGHVQHLPESLGVSIPAGILPKIDDELGSGERNAERRDRVRGTYHAPSQF